MCEEGHNKRTKTKYMYHVFMKEFYYKYFPFIIYGTYTARKMYVQEIYFLQIMGTCYSPEKDI